MLMSLLTVSFWWDIKSYGEEKKWDEEQKIEEMQTKRGNSKNNDKGAGTLGHVSLIPESYPLGSLWSKGAVANCLGEELLWS